MRSHEPRQNHLRREHLDAHSGQLNGEWEAVKLDTALGDSHSVLLCHSEAGHDVGRTLNEQFHGSILHDA
jgi:hypothetical protein